jgi:hypothetical protein
VGAAVDTGVSGVLVVVAVWVVVRLNGSVVADVFDVVVGTVFSPAI